MINVCGVMVINGASVRLLHIFHLSFEEHSNVSNFLHRRPKYRHSLLHRYHFLNLHAVD